MGWRGRGRILRLRGKTCCMTPIPAPHPGGEDMTLAVLREGGEERVITAPEYQNENIFQASRKVSPLE